MNKITKSTKNRQRKKLKKTKNVSNKKYKKFRNNKFKNYKSKKYKSIKYKSRKYRSGKYRSRKYKSKITNKNKIYNTKKKFTIKYGGGSDNRAVDNMVQLGGYLNGSVNNMNQLEGYLNNDYKIFLMAFTAYDDNFIPIYGGSFVHTDFILIKEEYNKLEVGKLGVYQLTYGGKIGFYKLFNYQDSNNVEMFRYYSYPFPTPSGFDLGVYMNYGIVEILDKIPNYTLDRFQTLKNDKKNYKFSYKPKPDIICYFYLYNVGSDNLNILKYFQFDLVGSEGSSTFSKNCNHFTRGIINFYNKYRINKPKFIRPHVSLSYEFIISILKGKKNMKVKAGKIVPAILSVCYYLLSIPFVNLNASVKKLLYTLKLYKTNNEDYTLHLSYDDIVRKFEKNEYETWQKYIQIEKSKETNFIRSLLEKNYKKIPTLQEIFEKIPTL